MADEPRWDQTASITVDMAARYLGLSPRYLVGNGWLEPGTTLEWQRLIELERSIYPTPETVPASDETVHKGGENPMMQMMMERCGCGRHAHGGHQAAARDWGDTVAPQEEATLVALRRAKRHLETQKADLEDQITELEERIRLHPDNHDPV